MKERVSSCDHGQATQMGAGMSDNFASMGDKVSEIILYLKVTFFLHLDQHWDWKGRLS